MRASSPWAVLGLEGPSDRSEVRRAYARRLKQVSPEDDPKGFAQLRAAYEAALARAETRRPEEPPRAAPAASEPASDPPFDASYDILGAAARAARERLEALLASPGASDGPALEAALDALFAPAALEAITARADAEVWLAEVILAHRPRSDRLLEVAVSRSVWKAAARRRDAEPVILRVIGRHEDLRARHELERPGHPHHRAFAALTSPTGRRLVFRGVLAPTLAAEVRDTLQSIRVRHPSLLHDLDPHARAWWEAYLSRRQPSPLLLWGLIIAAAVAVGGSASVLNAPAIDRLLGCCGVMAICLGLIGVEQFAAMRFSGPRSKPDAVEPRLGDG